MEGIQKLKCSSCGITFMSENNSPLCPTCSENSTAHHHGEEHGWLWWSLTIFFRMDYLFSSY